MLDAARQLFIEHGYAKTTMDEIAEKAEFGVATVYTYFKSKEGVFAEMARDDMTEIKQEGEAILETLPDDPLSAVSELLTAYEKVFNFISYGVMDEFIMQAKSNGPLRTVALWITSWKQEQICRALQHCQQNGRVSKALDTELASLVILDLYYRHNSRLTASPEDGHDFTQLQQAIAMVFEGWITNDVSQKSKRKTRLAS